MAEDYVRPPIHGLEPPSRRAAAWRFRLVILVLVLALAALVIYVVHLILGGGEGGGTVGTLGTLGPVSTHGPFMIIAG